jgi:TPR repeat protein
MPLGSKDVSAAHNIAWMYQNGLGFPKDEEESEDSLRIDPWLHARCPQVIKKLPA